MLNVSLSTKDFHVCKHTFSIRRTSPFSGRRNIIARAGPTLAPNVDPKNRVVITGTGVVSCFGNDVDKFYSSLLEGRSGVGQIDRFDTSKFPTKFAGQIKNFDNEGLVDGKNARRYDSVLSYSIVACKKALEQANLSKGGEHFDRLDKARVGVLVGSGMGGLQMFQDNVVAFHERGLRKVSPFFIPYTITNMCGALVAIEHGFMGPNYSISTACATANYAFVAAANHIKNGDADIMIAGGSEAGITSAGLAGFVACRALSSRSNEFEKASRPWDLGRDGFVMGEGAGVFVMESLEHARKRGAKIYAEFLGGAVNCDAHHMTDPRPDGLGVSNCIKLALKDSGVEPDEVDYVNAHATSTMLGDVAELNAVKSIFGNRSLKINGTKSMVGHALGGAGGLEGVVVMKAIETGWLHPTINLKNPVPELGNLDPVANTKKQHNVRVAISNSFGFGGHNSVVCLAKFEEK